MTILQKDNDKKMPLEKLKRSKLNKFQRLKNMKMTGLEAMLTAHCDESKLSEEYKTILDVQVLAAIQKELGLGKLAKPQNKRNQKSKPVKKKVNKSK